MLLPFLLVGVHIAQDDSVLLASHSFSFSSALPRWLILFFSLLSISAYVLPSYSKHESQPIYIHKNHFISNPLERLKGENEKNIPKTVDPRLSTNFPSVLP